MSWVGINVKVGEHCTIPWPKLCITFHFLLARQPPEVMASSFTKCLDHTQRRTTVGRTPLDEWSARRRDLYLITHNTKKQTSTSLRNSNPQSQQASARRATPCTARPLGPEHNYWTKGYWESWLLPSRHKTKQAFPMKCTLGYIGYWLVIQLQVSIKVWSLIYDTSALLQR
jgi:hypothetical protein